MADISSSHSDIQTHSLVQKYNGPEYEEAEAILLSHSSHGSFAPRNRKGKQK
jgi:hypothetical protein